MNRPSIRAASGFSLTELVVVIVIVTILSAFAISRINTRDFDAEGFSNELAATLRYAQKLAIAQRRNVDVEILSGTVSLKYAGVGDVRKPPGTEAYTLTVPTAKGVTLGGTLAGSTLTFSPLGRPTMVVVPPVVATLIVGGVGVTPVTITVEAETGYVH